MILIRSSSDVVISKANDEPWDFEFATRRYVIRSRLGEHETGHGGLSAVLSVLLSPVAEIDTYSAEELDDTVNDMLRLWSEGQNVHIDVTTIPFSYALYVGDQVIVEKTESYLDVTTAMNERYAF